MIDVLDADDGGVDHYVDTIVGLTIGGDYEFAIDEGRRKANTILHSAGHVIAGVVEVNYPGLTAKGGQHYPGECRVEFEGNLTPLDSSAIGQVNRLVAEAISQDLPVLILGDPLIDRLIKIGNFRELSCGGTHVRSLSEIGVITITKIKKKDGRLRLSYEVRTPSQ